MVILKNISINEVVDSTLYGIKESMETYKNWSGGEWLWNAPEYLITIKIAENIFKIKGIKYITLEDKVSLILKESNICIKDLKIKRINGKYDMVLWNIDEMPRAIIEIKNKVYSYKKIAKDIERIKDSLKNKKSKTSLKFGIMAFYISREFKKGNAKEKIEARIRTIYEELKKNLDISSELLYQMEKDDTDNNAYAAVAILLQVK